MSQQTSVGDKEAHGGLDMEEWNAFKTTHKKNYATEEEEKKRMKLYMENKELVARHNADYEKGLTTFKMGINHFSDMTPEEQKRHC